MAKIAFVKEKCTNCLKCVSACPFGALKMESGEIVADAGCKMCGLCVKACPERALYKEETVRARADLSKYKGTLVFAESLGREAHPVVRELMGAAETLERPIIAVIATDYAGGLAKELLGYGADEVIVYEDPAFRGFRAAAYAGAIEDAIRLRAPSIALFGATSVGRSLAPRLAARFESGLTADCTRLVRREDGALIQIRPAFGGNIMAQIVTPYTRPQFATVRHKVMPEAKLRAPSGVITRRPAPAASLADPSRVIDISPIPRARTISDAEIIVAAGRGFKSRNDLELARRLAEALGGELACSRPLAERGWAEATRQIGLSGRTVRPKLIITLGISGAIQFKAGMAGAERIVAVNSDPEAPIFKVAHLAVVGDLYEIAPKLISAREEGRVVV